MTAGQRSTGAALLFLLAAVLAGITPTEGGVEYRTFGLVEGVFALLVAHLLIVRGVWESPGGWLGWVAVGYATIATAQVLELLFPPPGVLEWVVGLGVAIAAWGILATGPRRRTVVALATLALLLSVLKFSMIPVIWDRIGPAPGTAFGLGDLAEGVRRLVADYSPVRPPGQIIGFVALALWALGTRLIWPARVPRPSPRGRGSSRVGPRDGA